MKKIFMTILCISLFTIPVFSKELPPETKDLLLEKLQTSTLVVYENGEIKTFNERGLEPVLIYLKGDNFKNSYVFDRTVGRAAAYLYVYGDADFVYAETMSKPAIKILKKNHIKYESPNIVKEIQNRTKTDLCPFEKLTKNVKDADEAYKLIYGKVYHL